MEPTKEDRIRTRAYELSREHPNVSADSHWFAASLEIQKRMDEEFAELLQAFVETVCGVHEDRSTIPLPVDLRKLVMEREWTEVASQVIQARPPGRTLTQKQRDKKNARAKERRAEARRAESPKLRAV